MRLLTSQFIELVKGFEGFSPVVYLDVGGTLTVGYGHVVSEQEPLRYGERVDQETASQLLCMDLGAVSRRIESFIPKWRPGKQWEFEAMCSLAFNIGFGAFSQSTLAHLWNMGRPVSEIADEFLKWNHVHGRVVDGLTKRRNSERLWFLGFGDQMQGRGPHVA